MSEPASALQVAAAKLLSARLVLEPDSEEVLAGRRYAPVCAAAEAVVEPLSASNQHWATTLRLFVGLTQSAQQSRRNEWSWRYEWVGFQWQTVRELLKRDARNGRRLAVIGLPATFTVTEQVVLLRAEAWRALSLVGVALCEDVELSRARTVRQEAPFSLHLPPHTRRMRYWTETTFDVPATSTLEAH